MKKLPLFFVFLLLVTFGAGTATAQRAAVSGKEVTGTFTTGRRDANQLRIAALGGGKLKVEFALTYAWKMDNGEWMANTGEASGIATIEGDRAVLVVSEAERVCRITMHFVKPGTVEVTEGDDCAGLVGGLNVTSMGTYKKVSAARPKFGE